MANEQNLTMAGKGITSTEQAQRMGKKGGLVKSPRKRFAAQLRELKNKGKTNEIIKLIAILLEYSYYSAAEILLFLEFLRRKPNLSFNEQLDLINLYLKWHKLHHGRNYRSYQRIESQRTMFKTILTIKEVKPKKANKKKMPSKNVTKKGYKGL